MSEPTAQNDQGAGVSVGPDTGMNGAAAGPNHPPTPTSPLHAILPAERPLMEMLRIAGPTVATMVSFTAMQFVDKLLVSGIGPEPIYVGAQGNGGLAAWVPIALAMGTLGVINTYVAQHMGAGRPERGAAYAWNGIWMGIVFYAMFLLPYAFVLPWLFSQAGLHAEQGQMAATYGQILIFGSVIVLAARSLSHFFYGLHKASVIMVASIIANIFNVALSYCLIFGMVIGPLEVPALGVAGSAIGTVIATGIELAIPLVLFLSPRFDRLYKTRAAWRISVKHVKDLIRIGWPGGVMFGNEMVCWAFFMVYLVSHFGPEHATAGWIAHQYMSLSFMPAVGLSVACTAVVGKYMGMGRPDIARARAWLALKLALGYMGLCAVLFLVFREPMIGLFVNSNSTPEVAANIIRLGALFLIATAAFQLFDAVAMILSGALRGAGDTVVPGVATVIMSWVLIVGGGLAMVGFFPKLESVGPWIAAASYIIILSMYLLYRFMGGHWETIKLVPDEPVVGLNAVVEPEAPHAEPPANEVFDAAVDRLGAGIRRRAAPARVGEGALEPGPSDI